MNNKITVAIIGIVVTGTAFYGGIKYDQQNNTASLRNAVMQRGIGNSGSTRTNLRGSGLNGNFISGEVLSMDDKSITLQMRDGGSRIIFISGSTSVTKSDSGTFADISAGKQISVTGKINSDGSVTAESIQIRPTLITNK